MPQHSNAQWKSLVNRTFQSIQNLAETKGREYSGDFDRLANFRRNALALGLMKETVWAIYAAKHWDAIMSYIRNVQAGTPVELSEPIEGRIDDLITYLLLFKAMVEEASSEERIEPEIPF